VCRTEPHGAAGVVGRAAAGTGMRWGPLRVGGQTTGVGGGRPLGLERASGGFDVRARSPHAAGEVLVAPALDDRPGGTCGLHATGEPGVARRQQRPPLGGREHRAVGGAHPGRISGGSDGERSIGGRGHAPRRLAPPPGGLRLFGGQGAVDGTLPGTSARPSATASPVRPRGRRRPEPDPERWRGGATCHATPAHPSRRALHRSHLAPPITPAAPSAPTRRPPPPAPPAEPPGGTPAPSPRPPSSRR
jgi:hypothetical protein